MAKSLFTRSFKLRVGVDEAFTFNGNYLRIVSASGGLPVLVTIEGSNTFELSAGEDVLFEEKFSGQVVLRTTAAAEDTVKIAIGNNVRMNSAKISGAVTISGTPTVNCNTHAVTISGTPTVAVTGSVTQNAVDYTASIYSDQALTAGSFTQLLAPGSNLNGLEVSALLANFNGGSTGLRAMIIAHTAAPSAMGQGDVIGLGNLLGGSTDILAISYYGKLKVPAGKGIYVYTSQALAGGSSNFMFSMLYKAL